MVVSMPVNLSIKNAPDDVVRRLRERAVRNHRSLQGELLAIIEQAVTEPATRSPREILARAQQGDFATASQSAAMIREDRDGR
jgi:plasmid stability protein